jgi:hypothetical protein
MLRPIGLALRARPLRSRRLRDFSLMSPTPPMSGGEWRTQSIHTLIRRGTYAMDFERRTLDAQSRTSIDEYMVRRTRYGAQRIPHRKPVRT